MQVKRINIDARAPRQLYKLAGLPVDNSDEVHALSVVLAGLVRGLLGNTHGSSTIVVSAKTIREVAEQGAWLEIAEDGDNLVLRTTLK